MFGSDNDVLFLRVSLGVVRRAAASFGIVDSFVSIMPNHFDAKGCRRVHCALNIFWQTMIFGAKVHFLLAVANKTRLQVMCALCAS